MPAQPFPTVDARVFPARPRPPLEVVNLNRLVAKGLSKPTIVGKAFTPPVQIPDLFDASADAPIAKPRATFTARTASVTPVVSALKRPLEDVTTGRSTKKAKLEAAREEAKEEEAKWRAKWLKVFPTLTFHFEIGVQESTKQQRHRVAKLGARVDQFFSAKVSHVIVRSLGTPTKAKPQSDLARASPKNPFLDTTGVTDLVQKAQGMGIKVWTVTKLTELLSKLAPTQPPALKADNLSAVLEDERIHGTRERDVNAPRADHYYFKPGNKFVLVEDATGKSRTIIAKEYESAEPYPCLFQTFMRPASVAATCPISNPRARAWALYVDRVPFNGERPPAELRRCVSAADLQSRLQAPSTPFVPEPVPYQNASGNSVVITDAVGSTSTANNTPAFHPALNRAAIAQMSKRVQVLKNNVQRNSQTRRASTGFTAPPVKQTVTQEQLIRMLRLQKAPWTGPVPTKEERMANRAKVNNMPRAQQQDLAPGYCENCRVRFNSLAAHLASKRHHRFVQNPDNFASLDRLLERLERPPNPALDERGLPPDCFFEVHGPLAPCEYCEKDWALNAGRWPPPCDDEHGPDECCEKCHPDWPENNFDHSEQIRSELTELMEEGVEDGEDEQGADMEEEEMEEEEEEDQEDQEDQEDEEEDVF